MKYLSDKSEYSSGVFRIACFIRSLLSNPLNILSIES
nr:MAG TPA: hypothetical protein [Caudoviricetes sp.]